MTYVERGPILPGSRSATEPLSYESLKLAEIELIKQARENIIPFYR